MRDFKLKTESYEIFQVEKGVFEEKAKGEFPYVQNGRQYAVCPSCGNTVQIIGLYTMDSPYAAHAGQNIPGFFPWRQDAYEACPRSAKGRRIQKSDRLKSETENTRAVYRILRDHLPETVYAARKFYGIYFSKEDVKRALNAYVKRNLFLYPWGTTGNIPYILFYLADNICPYGKLFAKNSDLYKKLEECEKIKFEKVPGFPEYARFGKSENKFLPVDMQIWGHKNTVLPDGDVCQTLSIRIFLEGKTIASETLVVDETAFGKIVGSNKGQEVRKKYGYFDKLAKEIMPEK